MGKKIFFNNIITMLYNITIVGVCVCMNKSGTLLQVTAIKIILFFLLFKNVLHCKTVAVIFRTKTNKTERERERRSDVMHV